MRPTLNDLREMPEPAVTAKQSGAVTLETAIARGLKEETAALTQKALETMSELDVVNNLLIPALDLVGDRYEKQEIFLPQLIHAGQCGLRGF